MSRILTGIQSTGTPHLGNILGAIMPAIEMANNPVNDAFLFIADLHSLTQIKDPLHVRYVLGIKIPLNESVNFCLINMLVVF